MLREDKKIEQELLDKIAKLPSKEERHYTRVKEDILLFASRNRGCHLGPKTRGMLFEVYVGISVNHQTAEDYYSEDIAIEDLTALNVGFKTANGNDWARSPGSYLGDKYNVIRTKRGSRVAYVRLDGKNKSITQSHREIRRDIQRDIKKRRCVVLDTSADIEVDHKSGRYDEHTNMSVATQRIEDFQPLSKAVNNAKRAHCKKCKETKKRYDARRLGYSEGWIYGDENTTVCEGCYWFDPTKFNSYVSKEFIKEK